MSDVAAWLNTLDLAKYAAVFAENDVDMRVLPSLTEDDLKELGVSLGHRRLLQGAISALAENRGDDQNPEPPEATRVDPGVHAVVPDHLARRIIESRYALAGERKQVTVLFADIKGSMALIAGMDPEYASRMMDPTVQAMMSAVHRFEGTVNRVLGDGIMALFGAPIAHEDHAVRACYAALAMRAGLAEISEQTRREIGVDVEVRIGINSGDVVVRAISNDLTMNYDAIGETTHLAARMEQTAKTGSVRLAHSTYQLARDFIVAEPLGTIPVKGMPEPVPAYELEGASSIRTRIQASAAAGFSRFVGRTAEMQLIEQLQETCERGRGQVVALVGEPGVGKSRLYYEYIHSSRVRDWLVLECGTVSHGKASAYVPIADLLRSYFGVDQSESARAVHERVLGRILTLDEELKDTLPAVLSLLDVPVEDESWRSLDPPQRRRKIRDAVRALLLREAEERPLILMLEDLHWFDNESLAVVGDLVDHLGGTPILMLVNFRPEFEETWSERTYYNRIRLNPLRAEAAADLLDHLVGDAPELSAVKDMLVQRTEGNPFFLEQSVRSLIETGALSGESGSYRLTNPGAAIEIPASVHSVLAARMDRLEPDCKHVLQCAAVVGKDFTLPLLQTIIDVDIETVMAALHTLQTTEFLYETRLFPDKEYTFRHALTHEVAYDSVIGHRRIELHAAIVDALEAQPTTGQEENLERLAFHATRGERWEQAFLYGRESGHRLEERNATQEAIEAYLGALNAFEHLEPTEARLHDAIELHFRIRDAYFVFGEPDKITPHLVAAEALAKRTGDVAQLAWSHLQYSASLWAEGELNGGLKEADVALGLAGSVDDDSFASLAHYRRGICLVGLGRFGEALDALLKALEWLDTEAGRKCFQLGGYPFVFVCAFLAWVLAELGDVKRSIEYAQTGYAHAEQEKHTYSQTVAGFGLGHALNLAGRTGEAVRAVERTVTAARDAGAHAAWAWVSGRLAYSFAAEGMREPALELIEWLKDPEITNRSPRHASYRLWVARALSELGEQDAAVKQLDTVQPVAEAQDERAVVAWCLWLRADMALSGNNQDASAVAALTNAASTARDLHLASLENHCDGTRGKYLG